MLTQDRDEGPATVIRNSGRPWITISDADIRAHSPFSYPPSQHHSTFTSITIFAVSSSELVIPSRNGDDQERCWSCHGAPGGPSDGVGGACAVSFSRQHDLLPDCCDERDPAGAHNGVLQQGEDGAGAS